ncbi:hypothetical protein Tco_1017964 [Tanacetum coccineum]|uniref:Retrotransposon gag domain-containing protein n=1 Tax=Tanacetum coccineum TaxID=301880 RepID=A0ABQ5FU24_9ASTR
MSNAAIEQLISERVAKALEDDCAARLNTGGKTQDRQLRSTLLLFEKMEMVFSISECAEGKKVKFAAATLQGRALTWWNSQVATLGLETANGLPWAELRKLMTAEFFPRDELALLCPTMVKPEYKKIKAYIQGLSEDIKGDITSFRPANLNEAICITHSLMDQRVQARTERVAEGDKRK